MRSFPSSTFLNLSIRNTMLYLLILLVGLCVPVDAKGSTSKPKGKRNSSSVVSKHTSTATQENLGGTGFSAFESADGFALTPRWLAELKGQKLICIMCDSGVLMVAAKDKSILGKTFIGPGDFFGDEDGKEGYDFSPIDKKGKVVKVYMGEDFKHLELSESETRQMVELATLYNRVVDTKSKK